MKKHFTDQTTGISYTLQGDYYLPDLELPTEEQKSNIGVWGMRHANYLKQNHKVVYYNLLTSGQLSSYLTEINERAEAMFQQLVKELSEKEDVTEQLKATDPMLWVQNMNNIRNRASEIVNNTIIYN
ncbi:MAG: TnpV protein [Ruminococcus sp.]|nr:TnpV protein [Ruminococcus sp.]